MANTFEYKQVWTSQFQKSNWSMPVYPVIADTQFEDGLKVGDTVHRRYASNPIFANDLGADGSYTRQDYKEAKESFTISRQKEATVSIVEPEVLHTDLDTTKKYGQQLANAIYQDIDGYVLDMARQGAGFTLDDGSFGGTAGNGLTVSSSNIADIPVIAMERFLGSNVVYNSNIRFGKLPYEDYAGMLCWIIPPQVWTVIQKYLMARVTQMGDRVLTNGYKGTFGDFEIFLSNNLPFTFRLDLGANVTDGDTFTIGGVTLRLKTTLAANGDVKADTASVANTATYIAAALNAPATTTANYQAFVASDTLLDNGFTVKKSDALRNITAVADATGVTVTVTGKGKVSLSSSFTSGSNLFTAAKQVVHSLFVIGKNVSLAVRKDPAITGPRPVSGKLADDYVMWTVYGGKVFLDQKRAIIALKVRCDAASFTAYSNTMA